MAASKKKVLIIAGHGEGDPGACSVWGQEADYTRELACLLHSALKSKVKATMYDQTKNCYEQSRKGNVPNYTSYDATLEVHFNAKAKKDPQGDGKFTGIGGYVHPSNAAGRKIAQAIMAEVAMLGFGQWGVFDSVGLLNLNNAQRQGAAYFLLETAFIDDGDDMAWYTKNKAEAARAIAQGILKGLGLNSRADKPKATGLQENNAAAETGTGYKITAACDVLNIRAGAGAGHPVVGIIREKEGQKKQYTIVEEKNGWGRLKSGAGWVKLSRVKRVDGEPGGFQPYTITTTCDVLNIRIGPGAANPLSGAIREKEGQKRQYTIVEEKNGWGRLKSGLGGVSLHYTRRTS